MPGLFHGTSLEQPVICERCSKPLGQCTCPRDRLSGKQLDPKDQALRVQREQRRGKWVTVVKGFAARSERTDDLAAMLKTLKAKFATGGSADGTTLELQGDHRDRLVAYFKAQGYPAKASGG